MARLNLICDDNAFLDRLDASVRVACASIDSELNLGLNNDKRRLVIMISVNTSASQANLSVLGLRHDRVQLRCETHRADCAMNPRLLLTELN